MKKEIIILKIKKYFREQGLRAYKKVFLVQDIINIISSLILNSEVRD